MYALYVQNLSVFPENMDRISNKNSGTHRVYIAEHQKIQGRRKPTLVGDLLDQSGSGLCLCGERLFFTSLSVYFARDPHISSASKYYWLFDLTAFLLSFTEGSPSRQKKLSHGQPALAQKPFTLFSFSSNWP